MKRLIHAFVLFGAAAAVYVFLTSEVPGGEKRWEHYFREFKDQHEMGI